MLKVFYCGGAICEHLEPNGKTNSAPSFSGMFDRSYLHEEDANDCCHVHTLFSLSMRSHNSCFVSRIIFYCLLLVHPLHPTLFFFVFFFLVCGIELARQGIGGPSKEK